MLIEQEQTEGTEVWLPLPPLSSVIQCDLLLDWAVLARKIPWSTLIQCDEREAGGQKSETRGQQTGGKHGSFWIFTFSLQLTKSLP